MICSWIKKLFNKKPVPAPEDKEIEAAMDEAEKVFKDAEKELENVFSEYDELDKILDETNRSK